MMIVLQAGGMGCGGPLFPYDDGYTLREESTVCLSRAYVMMMYTKLLLETIPTNCLCHLPLINAILECYVIIRLPSFAARPKGKSISFRLSKTSTKSVLNNIESSRVVFS